MSEIQFEEVTFRYPEAGRPVFEALSLSLPAGIVSLIGQNGTGKTTFLLLAGGSLLPDGGRVLLHGTDTRELRDERVRQRHVSMIYQNLEFESREPIGSLLEYVYENGFHPRKDPDFLQQLIKVLELVPILSKKTQSVSKGELQRTIIAFSLLYGSKLLLMDEPVFALEEYQKERTLDFLTGYARSNRLSVLFSLHELDLSRRYADYILLFFRDSPAGPGAEPGPVPPVLGPTEAIFTREMLEKAYEFPFVMLKKKEALFREALLKLSNITREVEP
jgi:ABC-type cobalamin/Fe3+-siderophores transport system ATPase subunit